MDGHLGSGWRRAGRRIAFDQDLLVQAAIAAEVHTSEALRVWQSSRVAQNVATAFPHDRTIEGGMLAREAGFRALYLSGAALSATLGLPDLGIITQEELCRAVKSLYRATHLPIIVDGDTGYGETLNVMRC